MYRSDTDAGPGGGPMPPDCDPRAEPQRLARSLRTWMYVAASTILGFVVYMLATVLAQAAKSSGRDSSLFGSLIPLLLVSLWLPVWLSVLIFKAGTAAGRFAMQGDHESLDSMMRGLRRQYLVQDIAGLVCLGLLLVAAIAALATKPQSAR